MKIKNTLLLIAGLFLSSSAGADTLVWDTGAGAGIQAGSGTWDFTVANWTVNDGASRISWSDNNVASFLLQGNAGTVTIGTPVGASGLVFSGLTGSTSSNWTMGTLGGNSIQVGSGGITNDISDGFLLINAPLVLTSSQTWTTSKIGTANGTASIRANGPISGTANLTFDGGSFTNAVATGNGVSRVVFSLGGANTFSGSTTVTGGAALRLDYAVNTGSKLDDASALIFAGGSLSLNGNTGANILEVVGSTTIASGANSIYNGPNGSGGTFNKVQLGAITRSTGANSSGTFDISNTAGVASTTTASTNGIIGGWATVGGNSWAVGSADGVTHTNITNTSGLTRSNSGLWGATENVNATNAAGSTESNIGNKTVNALRVANANVTLNFAGSSTLQITSGGIIAANTGQSITGGKITSGMATGELFVHTPNAFTIGSEIADGATDGILVKAGSNSLTLTGANTYSGGTFVNSGTLAISSTGSLANGNVTVRGAATFTLDATSAIKFNIDGESTGEFDVFTQDEGGLFTLNGTLNLEFGSTFSSETWDLFSLTSGPADGFTAINLTGAYSGSLLESGGLWSGTASGQNFTFNEATGILTVVPEPSTWTAVLAGGVILLSIRRRVRANLV